MASLSPGCRWPARDTPAASCWRPIPARELSATLIWGEGADERQTVHIAAGRDWSVVPLQFACGADTTEGRLEIVGKGAGTLPHRRGIADAGG